VLHSAGTEPSNGRVRTGLETRPEGVQGATGAPGLEEEFPASEKPAKRLNPIKRKQMQERAAELEEEISRLESAVAQCETSLQSFINPEETTRLSRELDRNRAELQARIAEWEQIGQDLAIGS